MPTLHSVGKIVKENKDLTETEISKIDTSKSVDVVCDFLERVTRDNVAVVKAGTGSGKSTILTTQMFLRNPKKSIIVTEPTKAITVSIPKDICSYGTDFQLGKNIGYKTGSISLPPSDTGVTFMTPAVLTQILQNTDPKEINEKIGYIFIDEVHKHDMNTDFGLKNIKDFISNNPDHPGIILMSATLNYDIYHRYYVDTKFIEVLGETFSIAEHYPSTNVLNIREKAVEIINDRKDGEDILIFVPSFKMIKDVSSYVEDNVKKVEVYAISSKDYKDPRLKKLDKINKKLKRVIVATNAAETGLTLPHLKVVIDTGMTTKVDFHPMYNASSLYVTNISKSSVKQRKGRVGRKSEGDWYPLYTKETEGLFEDTTFSELITSDMSLQFIKYLVSFSKAEFDITKGALEVKIQNKFNPSKLDLIFNLSGDMLCLLYDKLYTLGFIDKDWNITIMGYLASKFTRTTPENIKMIFSSIHYGVNPFFTIVLAAMLDVKNIGKVPFYQDYIDRKIIKPGDDMIKLLLVYRDMYGVLSSKKGFKNIMEWCEENEISFIDLNTSVELAYEMFDIFTEIFTLKIAIPTFAELDDFHYVDNIKRCIYEGYKLNMVINKFPVVTEPKTYYKPREINIKPYLKNYENVIFSKIMYKNINNRFVWCGDNISCVMDGVSGIDINPIF